MPIMNSIVQLQLVGYSRYLILVRQMASTGIDPFICLSGAASALYGPSHGGANEAALKMLEEIASVENIPGFIEQVKAKKRFL
jgi:citrate synthase